MKNLQISDDEAKFLLDLLNRVQGQRRDFRLVVEPLATKIEALQGAPQDEMSAAMGPDEKT